MGLSVFLAVEGEEVHRIVEQHWDEAELRECTVAAEAVAALDRVDRIYVLACLPESRAVSSTDGTHTGVEAGHDDQQCVDILPTHPNPQRSWPPATHTMPARRPM